MESIHNFCNGVIPFVWDRLPLDRFANIGERQPCLQEDWLVEWALANGSPFDWRGRGAEQSHRLLFRYARGEQLERGLYHPHPAYLLLHQMVILLPALFAAAGRYASSEVRQ